MSVPSHFITLFCPGKGYIDSCFARNKLFQSLHHKKWLLEHKKKVHTFIYRPGWNVRGPQDNNTATMASCKNWQSNPRVWSVLVSDKNRVTIHIALWRGWVIDAQRCCHDRLAYGRKTLRQNDWLLLFDVSVWLICDGWLHLQTRSALTVVMTPNISSVISE